MTHETISLSIQRPSIPPLHILLSTLPLPHVLEIDMNDNVSFSLGSFRGRVTSEGTEEDEFEGGRIGDSREQPCSNLDSNIELVPTPVVPISTSYTMREKKVLTKSCQSPNCTRCRP
jgi:hypothetical protein